MTHPCTLVQIEATTPLGVASNYWGCDLNPNDRGPATGYTVQLMGYNFTSEGSNLRSGETTFYAAGIPLLGTGMADVPSNSQAVFAQSPGGRRLAVVTGTKTVLAIRVVAIDSQTTQSESYVSDKVFGTSGDPANLKSQYAACSKNQLIMNPANKATKTGVQITNGVVSSSKTKRPKKLLFLSL